MQEHHKLQMMKHDVLELHGIAPGKKAEDTIRLIYKNANGFDGRLGNNAKIENAKRIHYEL